jgi:hypothetical protein
MFPIEITGTFTLRVLKIPMSKNKFLITIMNPYTIENGYNNIFNKLTI